MVLAVIGCWVLYNAYLWSTRPSLVALFGASGVFLLRRSGLRAPWRTRARERKHKAMHWTVAAGTMAQLHGFP